MKKTIFTFLIASIVFISVRSDDLNFNSPSDVQDDAVALQREVTEYTIQVRTSVPRVLGTRAEGSIAKVELNVDVLLSQEAKTRQKIYNLTSTGCVNNLRAALNTITEFTGFESSNCVARYDLDLSHLIQRSYGQVADYEKKFGDVLRIVPRAFMGKNMFTKNNEIVNEYTTKLAEFQTEWNAETKNITEFEKKFGDSIDTINLVFGSCFGHVQAFVNPAYTIIENEIEVCEQFDNSHDPFAVFQ